MVVKTEPSSAQRLNPVQTDRGGRDASRPRVLSGTEPEPDDRLKSDFVTKQMTHLREKPCLQGVRVRL